MATQEIVNLTDDLDNTTEGVQTVSFYDPETGKQVELELGEKNAKALNKAIASLEKYLAVARVVEPVPTKAVAHVKGKQAEIRAWALANGFKIGDRGRIKAEIVNAYNAAHDETGVELSTGPATLTVSPEAQAKIDEVASELDASKVAEVDSTQTDDDSRPATEEELQEMLLDMARNGQEPTADDLIMAEVDSESASK